ncbi:Hypothetical protein SCF082_LOCUS5810 [Durusdinium trenchii]|uniref:Uncharacterized protein n=1 Tax=Durusdinium trenchii TaxID=1381693 RepID=A0ABP0IC45_9DINO
MSWTARFGLCAWLALVVANATSLEDALELVTKNVTGQFGTNFTLIEALVCKEDLCASKATETMKLLSDAHYMRAVYGYGIRTSPNVEARVNLSSMEMKLIRHEEPFIEDNPGAHWPPVSGLTFEAAFARIRSEMDVTIQQATWRRPVHPQALQWLHHGEGEPTYVPRATVLRGDHRLSG